MDLRFNIKDLAKMFDEVDPERQKNQDANSDSDSEEPKSKLGNKGPGDIATSKLSKSDANASTSAKVIPKTMKNLKEIWDSNSLKTAVNCITEDNEDFGIDNISIQNDPRKTPNYETHYRQSVTTEDVFLHMGHKTPGTASCENLVVEVHLPGDNIQQIQLSLKKQAIDLRSPIHFLYLNLPHRIDPRAGNAKWDNEKEKLVITLHLVREFDEYNF